MRQDPHCLRGFLSKLELHRPFSVPGKKKSPSWALFTWAQTILTEQSTPGELWEKKGRAGGEEGRHPDWAAPPLEAWERRQQRRRAGCQRRDEEVVWEATVGTQAHCAHKAGFQD